MSERDKGREREGDCKTIKEVEGKRWNETWVKKEKKRKMRGRKGMGRDIAKKQER